MRILPLALLAALAGCASEPSDPDNPAPSKSSKAINSVVDAVISPLERKKVPSDAWEDDRSGREADVRVPRKAVKVKFATLAVDTPVPGMPVQVDGQPVGKSRVGKNGRGRLEIRVKEGEHVVYCNKMERHVIARAGTAAVEVTIPAFEEEVIEETGPAK
ncbi:MAG: hypothetical protein HYY18_15765 [Planctomycetes bacterium]|nr:hypothetical protein [Planctomycetota bacterium]